MIKNSDVTGINFENGSITSTMKDQDKMKQSLWPNQIITVFWVMVTGAGTKF